LAVALALPDVKLHLYGKAEAAGRKMGTHGARGHGRGGAGARPPGAGRVDRPDDRAAQDARMMSVSSSGALARGYDLVWRLLAAGHRVSLFNRGQLADPFGPRVERLRGDRTTDDFRVCSRAHFDAAVDFVAYRGEEARQVVSVLGGRVATTWSSAPARSTSCATGQAPAGRTTTTGPPPRAPDPAEHREWDYGMGKRAVEDTLTEYWRLQRFPRPVSGSPW